MAWKEAEEPSPHVRHHQGKGIKAAWSHAASTHQPDKPPDTPWLALSHYDTHVVMEINITDDAIVLASTPAPWSTTSVAPMLTLWLTHVPSHVPLTGLLAAGVADLLSSLTSVFAPPTNTAGDAPQPTVVVNDGVSVAPVTAPTSTAPPKFEMLEGSIMAAGGTMQWLWGLKDDRENQRQKGTATSAPYVQKVSAHAPRDQVMNA
jgi:hypothetical protein